MSPRRIVVRVPRSVPPERVFEVTAAALERLELDDDEPTLVGVAPFCDCPFCQENSDDR